MGDQDGVEEESRSSSTLRRSFRKAFKRVEDAFHELGHHEDEGLPQKLIL